VAAIVRPRHVQAPRLPAVIKVAVTRGTKAMAAAVTGSSRVRRKTAAR